MLDIRGKPLSTNDWTNRSDIANLLTQWSSGPGEESEPFVQESACCSVDRAVATLSLHSAVPQNDEPNNIESALRGGLLAMSYVLLLIKHPRARG